MSKDDLFWKDNFERDTIPWSNYYSGSNIDANNSLTNSSERSHHGKYCLKSTIDKDNSGATGDAKATVPIPNGITYVHMRAYVQLDHLPANGGKMRPLSIAYQITGDGALVYFTLINDGGTLKSGIYYRSFGSFTQLNGTACELNKWYCIELVVHYGTANDGWVKLYKDGKLDVSVSGVDHYRTFSYCVAGNSYSTPNAGADTSAYIDCLRIGTSYIGCEPPFWGKRHGARMGPSGQHGRLYLK